jgi:H(+)-translocating pyrophosphatase
LITTKTLTMATIPTDANVVLNCLMGIIGSVVACGFAFLFSSQVSKADPGTERMQELGDIIHDGAKAFLLAEYYWLAWFVAVIFVVLIPLLYSAADPYAGLFTGVAFLVGAILSASAGWFGMTIATKANIRTTQACTVSINEGLRLAFKSGGVMSMTVTGFGLGGLTLMYLIFSAAEPNKCWEYLSGFGFGGSAIALFARVGGGVYTKAADVGADLVGKVEAGIPEDDPNNPAVIADNVGDNVGDVAGMGADLFESYVGSIIACATLAPTLTAYGGTTQGGVALPFWIAGFGILCSVIGTYCVNTDASEDMEPNEVLEKLLGSINFGINVASVLSVLCTVISCGICFGFEAEVTWKLFGCTVIGLLSGNLIGRYTEYTTSYTETPTQGIARKSTTGPATVIIQGLGVGMISTVVPTILIAITIIACASLVGLYGVSIAAVGMLSTLGITLATDAYGPVADNAGGIAEMIPEMPEVIRERTDALDAMGNTTAATGKGFAVGSAVLTSAGLISAFMVAAGLTTLSITEPIVLVGLLIGAMLPFLFAALTMLSVGKSAEAIIFEVRRQFQACPELKTASATGWKDPTKEFPDYKKCVDIATESAIKEMVVPGTTAVFAPIVVGFFLTAKGLAGLLMGGLVSGFMLAVTMNNAGGAWDNSKKWVEKNGLDPEGKTMGKGTQYHEAVVVGDTVGDPFKDTSGPALNILIKLMSIVSLVIAPALKSTNPTAKPWETTGVIVGLVVLVVVGAFTMYLYKKFDDENTARADELRKAAEALEAQAAADAAAAAAEEGEAATTEEGEAAAAEEGEAAAAEDVEVAVEAKEDEAEADKTEEEPAKDEAAATEE